MHRPFFCNKTVNVRRAFRKEYRVWLCYGKTMWRGSAWQKTQKNRAMTSSSLAIPADPWVETTVSPDILPQCQEPEWNQINIIRLLCPWGWRKTTSNSSKSSLHSMTAISKEKLTLLKWTLQYYPYILIGMGHFYPSPAALRVCDGTFAGKSVAARRPYGWALNVSIKRLRG